MRKTAINLNQWKKRSFRTGFTLVEVLAVVATIAILVSLLCAALNHTKGKALRITCVNNLRQLQMAWMSYVEDNDQLLPLNQSAPVPQKAGIISRKHSKDSWVQGNPLYDLTTETIEQGSLFTYVGSTEVYRCPMDYSTVFKHPQARRNRSYAINAFLGGDDPENNPRVKMRYSEWLNPGKENTFVFIEEHKDSFWLPGFLVFPKDEITATALSWASTPSDRHSQGCNLTFADGHIEYWRWYSPKQGQSTPKLASSNRDMSDMRRLQARVPQK